MEIGTNRDEGRSTRVSAPIAREYRILAVVATGNATSLLEDGQLVEVDGSAGKVTRLADEGTP